LFNKNTSKKKKMRSNFAFINCASAHTAHELKDACDKGKIVFEDDIGGYWVVKADWARGNKDTRTNGGTNNNSNKAAAPSQKKKEESPETDDS
jgi:hypothetical protein